MCYVAEHTIILDVVVGSVILDVVVGSAAEHTVILDGPGKRTH